MYLVITGALFNVTKEASFKHSSIHYPCALLFQVGSVCPKMTLVAFALGVWLIC